MIAAILEREPDGPRCRTTPRRPIHRLLRRCLQKDSGDAASILQCPPDSTSKMSCFLRRRPGSCALSPRFAMRPLWTVPGAVAAALLLVGGTRLRNVAPVSPVHVHAGLGAEASLAAVSKAPLPPSHRTERPLCS